MSGGSRAQKALAGAPKVRVVGAISKELCSPVRQQQRPNFEAAVHAARAMSEMLGLSPGSSAATEPAQFRDGVTGITRVTTQ